MTYYSGTINYTITERDRYSVVSAYSTAACVQIYVAGELVDSAVPAGGGVSFNIPWLDNREYVRLLSVDAADADTDYFATAFPNDSGNHITVRTPTVPGYLPDEQWRVYLDSSLIKEREVWPYPEPDTEGGADSDSDTSCMGGRGRARGVARGVETYGSGRGIIRGLQRGFEPVMLEHETTALSPDDYEVQSATVDALDNETLGDSDMHVLDTYPAPPTGLAISSYVQVGDTLTLSFTASEDF